MKPPGKLSMPNGVGSLMDRSPAMIGEFYDDDTCMMLVIIGWGWQYVDPFMLKYSPQVKREPYGA